LLQVSLGKKVKETFFSTYKPDVVMCVHGPSYAGGIGRRIMV
jgi:hypothetical protein